MKYKRGHDSKQAIREFRNLGSVFFCKFKLQLQAARQGLAVLIASAVVVLNMKLQPFAKVTIVFQSIWNLAWVIMLGRLPALPNLVRIRWAVETPCWGNIYIYTDTVTYFSFFLFFFYSSTELQPIPVNQFYRTIAQKTRSGVRKTLLRMINV